MKIFYFVVLTVCGFQTANRSYPTEFSLLFYSLSSFKQQSSTDSKTFHKQRVSLLHVFHWWYN